MTNEYIDREALLERIDGIWDCNDMVFRPNDHCCNVPEDCKGCKWAETRDAIRRIVENAPAADVRPVVRGKWHTRFYYRESTKAYDCEMNVCSECGSEWSYDAETGSSDFNYCPNCGAEMKEET